ncbi:MAG TPA: cysteine hydrolase [Solirubrobacteraceae bacterium]|nr:cysteine hydrolase [Solirubrobacteraceae bacterium]
MTNAGNATSAVPHPGRCLVALVDFQNDFCHEQGAIARLGQDTSGARAALPNIERLLALARAAGVPRVHVHVVHSEWTDAPAWSARGRGGEILDIARLPVVARGSWGAEPYGIEPQDDELVLVKHRYSAFAYTPLRLVMQARGASHLLLAGVQTNVCIHATSRDAVQDGFVPVVVEDCVAAATPLEHETALADIRQRMGQVISLSDLRAAWGARATSTV